MACTASVFVFKSSASNVAQPICHFGPDKNWPCGSGQLWDPKFVVWDLYPNSKLYMLTMIV